MRRFAFRYAAWLAALYALLEQEFFEKTLALQRTFAHFLAYLTEKLLLAFGFPVEKRLGIFLHFPHSVMQITDECSGLVPVALFGAGVLASVMPLGQKLLWLAAGFFVIEGFNLVRLVFLCFILEYHYDLYDFFHYVVTQGALIAATLALFFFFLKRPGVYLTAKNEGDL